MKKLMVLACFLTQCLILSLWGGQTLADERAEREEASKQLKVEERNLKEFKGLISELERYANESSNANRRRVITRMQDMMVDEILAVEKRVAKDHRIQQHGVDARDKDRQAAAKDTRNTLPGEKKTYQNDLVTGGSGGKPSLSRLTHMQSIYRVCSRVREPAISKHERAVPAYIRRGHEFARLWEHEVRALRAIAEPATEPEPTQSSVVE